MNFLARCSHWSRVGLLDLAINLKSWLTRVLTISQQALSVRHWSARHCSISGRQWSGILMSPLLDGVDDTVQVDEELGEPEFGVEAGWLPELGDKLTWDTGGCIRYWKVDQNIAQQSSVLLVYIRNFTCNLPTALYSQHSSASFESFKTYCNYSNRTVEK